MLEGLGKLKDSMTLLGIETATFQLVEFFYLNIGGVESVLGPHVTAATTGLLYLPRVIVKMENLVQ
jgi:hypothetical protein